MSLSRSHPIGRLVIATAQERGWNVTNVGEAEVADALEALGYDPASARSQYGVGPYRLDFAIVAERIDIEADGWVHTAATTRARDAARDARLGEMGWRIVRIDIDAGRIDEQLRTCLLSLGIECAT